MLEPGCDDGVLIRLSLEYDGIGLHRIADARADAEA